VRAVFLAHDLMMVSRAHAAAEAAGARLDRVTSPTDLPPPSEVDLLIVDWSERLDGWGDALNSWREGADVRVVVFGRHTDLDAHAEARAAGLGPMWARSRLVGELSNLMESG
jgi:hypothetical protein